LVTESGDLVLLAGSLHQLFKPDYFLLEVGNLLH
jgi:hypothetical protein